MSDWDMVYYENNKPSISSGHREFVNVSISVITILMQQQDMPSQNTLPSNYLLAFQQNWTSYYEMQ